MTYRGRQIKVESFYVPDTTLHELNGNYVVDLQFVDEARQKGFLWLSADEAESLAERIKTAAAAAREWKDWPE